MSLPKLHIWGPGLKLSSLDPECLAAFSYCTFNLASDAWEAVYAHDPLSTPVGAFPALEDNETWIGGSFSELVRFLDRKGLVEAAEGLRGIQKADRIALNAHILHHAPPLLDAHLYTNPTNYIETTKPAWKAVLPRLAYLLEPPRRRSLAESRTAPLGLSAAAIDDVGSAAADPNAARQQQPGDITSNSPSLLFKRKQSVQAALLKQQSTTRFRVEGLLQDFLDPIEARLQSSQEDSTTFLFSSENSDDSTIVTDTDCLLYGYLSLLLTPTSAPWISDMIRTTYPKTTSYITNTLPSILNTNTNTPSKSSPTATTSPTPRISTTTAPPTTPSRTFTILTHSALTSLLENIFPAQFLHPLLRQDLHTVGALGILISAMAGATTFFFKSSGGGEKDKRFWADTRAERVGQSGEAGMILMRGLGLATF